jgi:hypothetical protein
MSKKTKQTDINQPVSDNPTTYLRFELHEQREDGRWFRVTSSRKPTVEEALPELVSNYQKLCNPEALRWILPAEMLRQGKLRVAKCTIEVLGEISPSKTTA